MKDLSLHVLDIVQNSVVAGALLIKIDVIEDIKSDKLTLIVEDNGKGMSKEFLERVTDPFSTSRTTRKVGLGIPMFKHAAESTGGSFSIESEVGKGTKTMAVFGHSHIDRQPLGDMAETMFSLVGCNKDIDFIYKHIHNENEFVFDTKEIKKLLDGVDITEPDILMWIKSYIEEGIEEIYNSEKEE